MFETVVVPLGTITVIALLSGLMLSAADKFLSLPVDERFTRVREALPGANCGACGYAGCDAYAGALNSGEEQRANLCIPGGGSTAEALAGMLGLASGDVAAQPAFVKCQGTLSRSGHTADYRGPKSCKAAKMVSGGETRCAYGCMGLGDCVEVCPYNAIYIHEGIAFIDPDYCTGCTLCVASCPQNLIEMRPGRPSTTSAATPRTREASPAKTARPPALPAASASRTARLTPSPWRTTWPTSTPASASTAASASRNAPPRPLSA